MKPFHTILTAALVCLLLTGCSELLPKPGQNADYDPTLHLSQDPDSTVSVLPEGWGETTEPEDRQDVHTLTTVVTERTIRELEEYPNLETLDLCGSTCYTAIMVYIQEHPEVEVTYSVDFGGTSAINWAEDVSLKDNGLSFTLLSNNLVYLPNLKTLHLPMTGITYEEISILRELYPEVQITYTAGFRGREYTEETEQIDFSGMTVDEITQVIGVLKSLPNVNYVELMNASGTCSLSRQDVKTLMEAAPDVRFHYVFNLFGRTVSTTDNTIKFENLGLTESAEGEIREALSIMAPGSSLILDRCGLGSEFLASIREDYDKVDLVWRVYFGTDRRYSYLTNAEMVRCVYNVTDSTCSEMQYLRSVKYMDLGHNDTLTDVSFLAYMTELEILILSGTVVTDLSGIENCKKLEFLEMANCLKLEDITPLAGCDSLKYLNICITKVSSLMPLDGLDIRNLFCKMTRVSAEEQRQYNEIHQGSVAVFSGRDPYAGPGWRYTDYGYTYTDFYKRVREVFKLDEVDARIRAQEQSQ